MSKRCGKYGRKIPTHKTKTVRGRGKAPLLEEYCRMFLHNFETVFLARRPGMVTEEF